jgi:hypothetical protein
LCGRFYQDDNDNLRGYPLSVDKQTRLIPHVIFVEILQTGVSHAAGMARR